MTLEYRCPTLQELRTIDVANVIASTKRKECSIYVDAFRTIVQEAEKNNDQSRYCAGRLLFTVAYLFLRGQNEKEPLQPMETLNGVPVDELKVLMQFVHEVADPELRARIEDLIWVRLREYKLAESAIDHYIESAKTLEDPEHWVDSFNRIERAFRLAATLGGAVGRFDKVVAHIESMVKKYDGKDPKYFSEKLMSLLCEQKLGDPTVFADIARKAATFAADAGDHSRARVYWHRKAEWERIAGDEVERKNSLIAEAETYVKEAENSIQGQGASYMRATHFLTKGIEAYRRIGGMQSRVEQLHALLLEYEKQSLREFGVIKSPGVDLSKAIEEAKNSVKGKSLLDALVLLSTGFRIETVDKLRKRVEDSAREHPLLYLLSSSIVNEKGKVVGKKPGIITEEGSEFESGLRTHMFHEAAIDYSVDVPALIQPMRRQIVLEHNIRIDDLSPIVVNHPLIPQHREYLYAKGLLAGLNGDFIEAIHILIPQFENSVRYILEQHGVIVSSLNDEGIQQEHDLNVLMYRPELKKLFGIDLVFHLQNLLVEKGGANIRNRMAHGLMYPGDFHSTDCVFLWALILRLCCGPIIESNGQPDDTENGKNL